MKDKVSLTLNGEIPVNLFAEAISGLSGLLHALTEEIAAGKTIEWQIIELSAGSATAVIQGIADTAEDVEKITTAYAFIGRQLQIGNTIPYSPKVIQSARKIASILDGKVSSIEFGIDGEIYHITQSGFQEKPMTKAYSYGVITGKVENLIGHKTLKFTLYDNLFNRGVTCYVEEEKRELLRNIWGKTVSVTGYIYRDIITGRPLEIHDIETVEIVPMREPGAYKKARGALSWKPGDETADQTIRRLRDDN
ncbi:hypothetical protein BECAL_02977 [Bellilinea caldifistulae]|uniref:Uncharacterized protein n=1 Tax=Bellilinea caldifistulae TaxID=360411 RepID=A0A0P6XI08_9CHLR|nr:hypothetical protein [Bellilinea caldifistulae]KPL74569.1 hypothetical protein AC812_12295 [Bellilinea caldifistulae]GAP11784.1 hypothetical protein BECAL_02977 [Bellilinea caldifistulae]